MTAPTSKGPRSNPNERPASGRRLKTVAPCPAPSPLEALLAGLAALLEAHREAAFEGPTLVLWQVLSALHGLASRALAAPSALALEALAGGASSAGMVLRSAHASPAVPRMSELQHTLIGHTQGLLEELDEARWHAQQLGSDLEVIATGASPFLEGARETLGQLRSALHLAEGTACALSAALCGEESTASPARHAVRLARLWIAASPHRVAIDDIEVRRAVDVFTP
jgi:hypothetical protein